MSSSDNPDTSGKLVRSPEGNKFVKGVSGNPAGRPKGSKNKITLMKLAAEEAIRDSYDVSIKDVLGLIIAQALDGDRPSQKMVWDAVMSKSANPEDKNAGKGQGIVVKTMNITPPAAAKGALIEGEYDVVQSIEEDNHE